MKKKILYIGAASDNLGGIEIYIMNVYNCLDKEKYDVKFLVCGSIIPSFNKVIKNDIIRICDRKDNYIKYLRSLKKIFIKNEFDIVHINLMSFSNFEPIVLARKYSSARVVLHSHISDLKMSFKTKVLHCFGKFLIKKYDDDQYIKVACSSSAGKWMFGDFSKNDYIVLNNGIDLNKYIFSRKSRNIIRKQLKIKDEEILLGNIGRLCEQKNQIFLINLMNLLDKKYKLLIIGKGELEEYLHNNIDMYKLNDRIIFLKDIYNVEDYLSSMDIFLFPSIYEGLGIVAIESQANGLWTFVSNHVPNDVNVTNNIEFLDLNLKKWITEINKCNYKERNKDLKKLYDTFDYKMTSKKVIKIYDEIVFEREKGSLNEKNRYGNISKC